MYGPRLRHGEYLNGRETSEHAIWRGMISRCCRTTSKDFHKYGGRGITVCERWLKFENFLEDVGRRPPDHTLDRIDNDGNYEPTNCRWATHSEQQTNKRTTRVWSDGEKAGPLIYWAHRLGVSKELAHWRMKHWGTFEKGKTWQELQKRL